MYVSRWRISIAWRTSIGTSPGSSASFGAMGSTGQRSSNLPARSDGALPAFARIFTNSSASGAFSSTEAMYRLRSSPAEKSRHQRSASSTGRYSSGAASRSTVKLIGAVDDRASSTRIASVMSTHRYGSASWSA